MTNSELEYVDEVEITELFLMYQYQKEAEARHNMEWQEIANDSGYKEWLIELEESHEDSSEHCRV